MRGTAFPSTAPRMIIRRRDREDRDLGVEIRCSTTVGKEISLCRLRAQFAAVFVGIGAHQARSSASRRRGPGRVDRHGVPQQSELEREIPIATRSWSSAAATPRSTRRASRSASRPTRPPSPGGWRGRDDPLPRTRAEMPAIGREIDEASRRASRSNTSAPLRVLRNDDGSLRALVVQRMKLGEPDASGRGAGPSKGETMELPWTRFSPR